MSKPSILLLGGAWHTPEHFRPLQTLLEKAGYAVQCPRLPSNSLYPPQDALQQGVKLVRTLATQLIDEGKEIIVLMHSYGGYFGTEALAGLGIKERAPKGLAGGIKWLAYMAAGLPRKGMGVSDIEVPIFEDVGKGGPVDPMSMVFEVCVVRKERDVPESTNKGQTDLVLLPKDPVAMFYHDVPEDLRKQAVADLTGFAKWGLMAKVDNESWRNIDVAYLKCTDDRALPFPMQEKMIRDVQELGIEVRVSSCDSSHSPYLSQPQTVVDWIEGLTAV